MDWRFSGLPPSQYWKDIMKDFASLALSPGKYLSTFGSVRSSFNIASSNEEPSSAFFFFMNSETTDLDCPSEAMVNPPTLLRRMTSGMDGKMRTASKRSRSASTTSFTCSASSWTKINEPMKTFASSTSFLKAAAFFSSRSSSSRYPTHSQATPEFSFSLIALTAADMELWYWLSRTTYTTFRGALGPAGFSLAAWYSSVPMRRSSGELDVNMPPPLDSDTPLSSARALDMATAGAFTTRGVLTGSGARMPRNAEALASTHASDRGRMMHQALGLQSLRLSSHLGY